MSTTEPEFRNAIRGLLDTIERAFENVDPDLVECEQSQGALIIKFSDGSKCILSAQPSVKQLWMAVASRGVAFHFDLKRVGGSGSGAMWAWEDDKGQGLEPLSYLKGLVKEFSGLEIKF